MDGPEAAVVVDEVLLVKAEVEITAGLALVDAVVEDVVEEDGGRPDGGPIERGGDSNPGWPENGAGPRKFGPPVGKEPSLGGPTHAGLGPPLPLAYGSFLDVETPPGPKGAPGPGPKPGP